MSILLKKKTKQRVVSVFLSMTTALWLSGAAVLMPTVAHAATIAELQTQIADLLAQITQLQAQLSALQGTPSGYTFAKDLSLGSTGSDVKNLQIVLNSDSATQLAASGVGSSGNETEYFGPLTKAAVVKFQNKYAADVLTPIGLTAGTGYVGSMSRAKLNALYGGVATTPTTTTTTTTTTTVTPAAAGTLKVEAGVQPAASLAPDLAARLPFTVIKLTAPADMDITVSSLTVERTGLAQDLVFSKILLLDENGNQIGLSKTLNSSHQVILNEAFTVTKGTAKTITIAANRADTAAQAGQIAYLSLVAIDAGTATIDGTLPITGAGHTINESLTIGTVTMNRGSIDPGSAQTKEVGLTGYTFSSIKVTAGSQEKIRLLSIRWYQSGSAAKSDLENIKTYIDGTSYDTTVSSDGKYYTSTFDGGILIDKGFSKELSIKGDIVGGSARNIAFDVAKMTDLFVKGESYGYGVTPPQTNSCSGATGTSCFTSGEDPWYDAAVVTISQGTMTVSVSTAVSAQNIAINLANQLLGAVSVNVKGEPISVSYMDFNVTLGSEGSNDDVDDITNVTLVDENGSVVAGPVDGSATPDTTGQSSIGGDGVITFSDAVVFPVGIHTYTLKGKIGTDIDNNVTVTASTTPSLQWTSATGQVTGVSITPSPTSAITLSQMTVKSGALTISVSSVPIAQTVIAGTNQFTFANFILDAGASGEDVRLTSLPPEYNVAAGSATDLINCQMYDGATSITTGSNVKNPTAAASSSNSFTFDGTGLTISKGTTKTLALKCDVISGSTGQYYWGIDGALDDTASTFTGATGLTSGQTVTEVFNDSMGQKMTASGAGTLTVALDTNSPGYKIVQAGATNVELSRIKFIASNEDIDLRQVALELTGVASNTPIDLVGRKVTLWDTAGTQVGEATFPTGDTATSSTLTSFRVPRNSAKVLVVKGDIAAISVSGPLTRSGDLLKVDWDSNNKGLAGTYGVGVSSGSTVGDTASEISGDDTASTGVRIMNAYPSFAKLSVPSAALIVGSEASKSLYRFSVTANNGDVAIYKLSFTMGSSSVSATTSTYGLYVYTDSGFSAIDSAFTSDGLVNYGNCVNGRNNVLNATPAPGADDSPLVIEVYPDKGTTACNATTTYTVASGATRYFDFTATIASVEAATGVETISARLDGDAAYPVNQVSTYGPMDIAAGVENDTHNDFIWSPISTTTSVSRFDVDFTNGYGVSGLPGTFMSINYFTSPN